MSSAALSVKREIIYIPVDKIEPNPYQPRRYFDTEGLEDLARSITQYGVIQPVSVRLVNGTRYELVAGERRLRASKLAGLLSIPAIIININEEDSAVIAIIENLQRQDLNFIEEAQGFLHLLNDYNFTQEELAERVGKSQSTVANKLRILKLSHRVRKFITDNSLSERHARALLKLPNEELQIEILKKIVELDLTVQKTEDIINKLLADSGNKQEKNPKKRNRKMKQVIRDLRIFNNSIKENIELLNVSGFKTDYIIDENDDGCEILIKVEYNK